MSKTYKDNPAHVKLRRAALKTGHVSHGVSRIGKPVYGKHSKKVDENAQDKPAITLEEVVSKEFAQRVSNNDALRRTVRFSYLDEDTSLMTIILEPAEKAERERVIIGYYADHCTCANFKEYSTYFWGNLYAKPEPNEDGLYEFSPCTPYYTYSSLAPVYNSTYDMREYDNRAARTKERTQLSKILSYARQGVEDQETADDLIDELLVGTEVNNNTGKW